MQKIVFEYEDTQGNVITAQLHAKWTVCERCGGEGTHDPVEFNGLTHEDFSDPHFTESYLNDVYAQPCSECAGRTTVLQADATRANPDLLQKYEELQIAQHEDRKNERYWARASQYMR